MTETIHVRFLVLGDDNVGKSTLVKSLCGGYSSKRSRELNDTEVNFNEENFETTGCDVSFRLDHTDGYRIAVSFWVVCAANQYSLLRPFWLRTSEFDAVLLIHDLTWARSRHSIRSVWLPLLESYEKSIDEEQQFSSLSRSVFQEPGGVLNGRVRARSMRSIPLEYTHLSESDISCESSSQLVQSVGRSWQFGLSLISNYCRYMIDTCLDLFRDLISQIVSADDLLNRAEERRLFRSLRKPVVLVGTKLDLAKNSNRFISPGGSIATETNPEDYIPGCLVVHLQSENASNNARLNAFLRKTTDARIHYLQTTNQVAAKFAQ
mmetsp:Transcript_10138/g.18264  ORF Transcript_10138/g.18264 Transcript_10138/m.18264 type:complete len:321 (-) Transcript_10138:80-1042(-)